eukprot:436101-Lingulodinium_polyedra.AAC.1
MRVWATRKRDSGRVKSEYLFRVGILSNLKLAVECHAGLAEASSARCMVSSGDVASSVAKSSWDQDA